MIQLIQQWKTSTTCIGQSFQTFFRKYIGCPGIKNEEGRRGQGTSRKEKWQGRGSINEQFPLIRVKSFPKGEIFPFSMVKNWDRG